MDLFEADCQKTAAGIPGRSITVSTLGAWCKSGRGRFIARIPGELITITRPNIAGNMSRPVFTGSVSLPDTYVAEIKDCAIWSGSRLILTDKDEGLHDEMSLPYASQYGNKLNHRAKKAVAKLNTGDEPRRVDAGIIISCDYERNYFHWLIECLPKLIFINQFSDFDGLPLIVDDGLHPNLYRALQILNRTNRPLINVKQNEIVLINRLIVPSDLSRLLDNYDFPVSFQRDCILNHKAICQVRTELIQGCQTVPGIERNRRIYISRRQAAYRKLVNELELINIAQSYGLEIVEVDGLSLDQQIALFSSASLVVGPTGASCTNLIFCEPGAEILIMTSNDPNSNFQIFHQLAQAVSCSVTYLLAQRILDGNTPKVHANCIMDAEVFKDVLLRMIANIPTLDVTECK